MGPKCAHYAPTMRPLCARYFQKPFRSRTEGPKCAHSARTLEVHDEKLAKTFVDRARCGHLFGFSCFFFMFFLERLVSA
jgi:hypothetical protein